MVTRVLVVDDNRVERILAQGLLRKNPEFVVQCAINGRQALEKIETHPPHLVVTDLMMPEMNGLELVRLLRQQHPAIPVILMTAYGDEDTAVKALDAGAASYVPKAQRAERLVETVERVAEHAAANRSRGRLARCMLDFRCRYALPSDRRLIRALVNRVQHIMTNMRCASMVERIRIGEALEEALLNAMYHGNLEIGRDEFESLRSQLDDSLLERLIEQRCQNPQIRRRRVLAMVHLSTYEACFVIRDEGQGFRPISVSDDADDSTNPFEHGYHRGLTLIRSLMDEVKYNKSGNQLLLRRRYSSSATGSSPSDS
ncbi:MAG: response regulator [Pirellulaceae bacterium]